MNKIIILFVFAILVFSFGCDKHEGRNGEPSSNMAPSASPAPQAAFGLSGFAVPECDTASAQTFFFSLEKDTQFAAQGNNTVVVGQLTQDGNVRAILAHQGSNSENGYIPAWKNICP